MPYEILLQHVSIVPCLCVFGISHFGLYYLYSSNKSHTSLVAQQTRLSEWADLIRDCQNRPQGMKIDEWCQLHNITKASYYWRLRKVREAYLETAEQTQTFVEVPSSAIHPVNMTSEHKIAAVIRCRNHLTLEITEQASASFLKTLLGVISNAQ